MPRKNLLNFYRKDESTQAIVQAQAEALGISFHIKTDRRLISGQENPEHTHRFEIRSEENCLGTLHADSAQGALLVQLVELIIDKELQRRKVGSEVLGLYREINMIYSFNEKIVDTLSAKEIAEIALSEAAQIVKCSHGVVLMYDPLTTSIGQLAGLGHSPNRADIIEENQALLQSWIDEAHATILPVHELANYTSLTHLQTLMHVPLKVKDQNLGLIVLGHDQPREFTAAELKLLTAIGLQTAASIESVQLYEKNLRDALAREEAIREIHKVSTRFVPVEFIEALGKTNLTEVSLGDLVEREVTVVFSDIRDYTSFSESLTPQDNFLFVNAFNGRMGPVVRKHNGFINQYLGDGFMAIFPYSPEDALRATIEMHAALNDYNQVRREKNRKEILMGVGMHTGKLIMGITGDIERLDPATVSDTVNTASRIEGLSKHFGTSILLTEDSQKQMASAEEFDFRALGLVQVKGRKKPVQIFECINSDEQTLYHHKRSTAAEFRAGMDLYLQREFAMAAVTFQSIVKKHDHDHPARLMLNRSAKMITAVVDENWRGVETMLAK